MDPYLELYMKVVEKRSFTKAAEELHMTQPAVSQHIRTLEQSLGVRLLERSNKDVRMNKAGEIVYHHAREIRALYARMQYLVDDLSNHAGGPLTIGASYTFGEYILPHVVARLKEAYPQISPTIIIHNTKEIAELVLANQLDVGIVEGEFSGHQLHSEIVSEDHMVVVASPRHPMLDAHVELQSSELAEETWILREEGSGTRQAAELFFARYGIVPQAVMEFGSTQVIKEAVEAGLGISLLSKWAIAKELAGGYIGVLHVEGLPFKRNFSILSSSSYQTKALETFIETLKHYLKQMQEANLT